MIYLLEDDDSIRKLVLYGLDSQGFQAKGFALPSEFWRAMDAEMPELILLDIMLPEEAPRPARDQAAAYHHADREKFGV